MVHEAHACDVVHAAAVRGIHLLGGAEPPFSRGSAECQLRGGFDGAPVVVPALILIGDNFSGGVGSGANFTDVGRTVVVPTVLVPAHELQTHGLSGELRQNRGGLGDIVVATVAVGARAFVILHANFLRRQAENSGDSVAGGVDVLRR